SPTRTTFDICVATPGRPDAWLLLLQPGHHPADLLAHLLDRVLGVQPSQRLEARLPGLVLQDPFSREFAGLDLAEDLLHLRLLLGRCHPRPARVVPEF